jgi:hypothetical protein
LAAFDAAGATNCTPASPAVCTPLWSVSFPPGRNNSFGPALSAPAVNGANVLIGAVVLGPGGSFTSMQAFTAATGKFVFATGHGGQQSPVVTGDHLYASVTDVVHQGPGLITVDYLATFNAIDGGGQFVDLTGHFGRPSAPAVANGVLYATDGALEVYDAAGVTNCGPQYEPPEAQGRVFASQWCGPLWTGSPAGSEVLPAVANGSVYVAGGAGTLSIFAAGGCGATTCSPPVDGQCRVPTARAAGGDCQQRLRRLQRRSPLRLPRRRLQYRDLCGHVDRIVGRGGERTVGRGFGLVRNHEGRAPLRVQRGRVRSIDV